jgi:predicted short-subunit dehydrogenase-like oxidoreductase (DUF2520 family)
MMDEDTPHCRIAVIGRGRLGGALALALRDAGYDVDGPLARDQRPGAGVDVVFLCVPDGEIAAAAGAVPDGPLVGHCSGASGLEQIGRDQAFSLHPLMTLIDDPLAGARRLRGAGAAIAGTSAAALAVADRIARHLGMEPFAVAEHDRAAYHAAAAFASNFLVTLEGAAERLAETVGVERRLLAPLVQATVENWAAVGARPALTGPIVRGDEATVARQRAAIMERAPDLVPLFDELAGATRSLSLIEAGAAR